MEPPLIQIHGNNEEYSFHKTKELIRTTNKLSFKNRLYLNTRLVDSLGNCYKVIDAHKGRNLHPFWKFEFFNPMFEITLEVEKISRRKTLDSLKSDISSILKKEFHLENADGQLEYKLAVIERAKTLKELINDMMNLEYYGA